MLTILLLSMSTHSHSVLGVNEIGRKGSTPVVHGETWQGHASCLRRIQLVGSFVELSFLQKCSGSTGVG